MKKVKYLLLLGLLVITMTGCVKFNANMDIKKDKSMNFSIIYAFDKTIFGEENKLKEEDLGEVKKQGFSIEKYSEGNYEGFKLTKKITNIDEVSTDSDTVYDLSGMAEETENNKYIFKVVKGEDKNIYTAKIKFDANNSELNSDDLGEDDEIEAPDEVETVDDTLDITSDGSDMDLSGIMSNMDLSFSVNLPYSAISSNATTKENDNKKLSWKLGTTSEELIEFSFELKNNESNGVLLYVGIGVVALVIALGLALVLTKKKKNVVVEPKKIEKENK